MKRGPLTFMNHKKREAGKLLHKNNKNVFAQGPPGDIRFTSLLGTSACRHLCLKSKAATRSNIVENGNSLGTCGRGKASNPFHVFTLKAEEPDRSVLLFPRLKAFVWRRSAQLYCLSFPGIFDFVSSVHSCRAKHMFVLQSLVWCWRSLGWQLRL